MQTLAEAHDRYREIRDHHRATANSLTLVERAPQTSRRERPGTHMPAERVTVKRTDLVDAAGTVHATIVETSGYFEGFIAGSDGRRFGSSFKRDETIAATRNAVAYHLLDEDAEATELFHIIETATLGVVL